MTTTKTPPAKGPQKYRYVGIEDIRIDGRDIRYGDEIEGGDHMGHDKRFEKVADKK